MYYEVYADSMFLLHFILDFYLLLLVNQLLYGIASLKRIAVGAALGAVCSVLPIFLPMNMRVGGAVGFLLSVWVMSKYTFRVAGKSQWLQVLEKMLLLTLIMGGLMRMLLRWWPHEESAYQGMLTVLTLGSIVCWLCFGMLQKRRYPESDCKVILQRGKERKEFRALLDTGNTLVEPISQKPVSVAEPDTLKELFGGEIPEEFRVVPFRSVGKKHGWLKAYLLEQITVEVRGIRKECKNVYIAVSDEFLAENSEYQVILNPCILENKGGEAGNDYVEADVAQGD